VLRILKVACLAIYGLALAGLAGCLPYGLARTMQVIAVTFLVIHVFEVVFASAKVRLYPGRRTLSILLTLLFGALHWIPLAKSQATEH
jgi:uncharacterized protein YhhL (DUF1145 family)